MIDSNTPAHHPGSRPRHEQGDGYAADVAWVLDAVRSAAADTGHPATQHALDAALLALEDALTRLGGPPAAAPGGVP